MNLICYDIANNASRAKVANLLLAHGYARLQKSVFIGERLSTPDQVWATLVNLLDHTTDHVAVIRIHQQNLLAMKIIGTLPLDLDLLCGRKSSLFF